MNKLAMTASVISILIAFIVLAVHKGYADPRASRQPEYHPKDLDVRSPADRAH